jgi:chromosome segregation ATPase
MADRRMQGIIAALCWLFLALFVCSHLKQHLADLETHRRDLDGFHRQHEEKRARLEYDIQGINALAQEMQRDLQAEERKMNELKQSIESIELRLKGSEELRKEVKSLQFQFSELKREVGDIEEARHGSAR